MNSTELTPEKTAELKQIALKILENCRTNMLNRHPFIGTIAMSLNIFPIRDARCKTACTDGNSIFFDIDFLSTLNDQEREFVLAHEIWHNVMMHFLRTEARDKMLFNYATDMEVNEILKNDGFSVLKNAVLPSSFGLLNGLCAEEYYDLLKKRAEYDQDLQRKGSGSEDGEDDEDSVNSMDRHIYEDEKIEEICKERTDRYGKVGKDEDFNPNMTKESVEKIRESVVSAAQQIERMHGELPSYVKKIVDGLLKPKISWKEVIAAQITSAISDKTNWNIPNRRFAYSGTYLPAHIGEKIKIAVGIDTSGSCGADFQQFISEVNNIAKSFGNYEIHMIQCDTEVKKYELYDDANPLDIENNKIEFIGNGGTILKPIFDYVNLNELDVDTLIMFTDGYCEDFEENDAPDLRVIWAITGSNSAENIKFGEKINLTA